MNPAPTALDTGRPLKPRASGDEEDKNLESRPSHGHRHGNSRGTIIAMILGACAFMVCIGLIAFGGTSSDSGSSVVATTTLSNENTAVQPDPPAAETQTEQVPPTDAAAAAPATTQVADEFANEELSTEQPETANEDTTTETVADTTTTPQESSTEEPETADENATTETVADTTTTPQEVPAVRDPDSPPVPPGAPERYSVLSGGKIYLRGTLPDATIGHQVVAAVEQVMGPGNVVGEYVIDPTKPFDPTDPTPVYINDTITFASGSAEIEPDFYPLIATTPVLLAVQPTVVVTITGHTDSQGSEEANLALSQARVDAVRDWVISQGGDGERLIAVGKGEAEPVADNDTEEGRLANRRVEFLIEGFDFTPSD